MIQWKINKDDISQLSNVEDDTFLYEDMFQASFKHFVLDCGWYGDETDGRFMTLVIKDFNREDPMFKMITYSLEDAKWSLLMAQSYFERIWSTRQVH
jgi:hypothetical protein